MRPAEPSPETKRSTFLWIWSGQTLSLFGSGLTAFAIAVWVYQDTGSATKLSWIYFCSGMPMILSAPLAGVLIDRWDRRWTMIVADTGGGLAILTLVLLLWSGQIQFWHILVLTALATGSSAMQSPAFAASTPLLVDRKDLNRANGLVHLGNAMANLLAPMAGGFLVGVISIHGVVLIDAVTFVLAVTILLLVSIPKPRGGESTELPQGLASAWRDTVAGLRYIWDRPGLLGLLAVLTGISFAVGLVQVLITPLVLSFSTSAVLGSILASAGAGMVAGGLVMTGWSGPNDRIPLIVGALGTSGLMLVLASLAPNPWLIGGAAFGFMFCVPIVGSCCLTLWQLKVEVKLQGRVFSMRQMIGALALSSAYLAAGPLAEYVFEPWLAGGSVPARWAQATLGAGPGRGIALLFATLGILLVLAAASSLALRPFRQVETDLPDLGYEGSETFTESVPAEIS